LSDDLILLGPAGDLLDREAIERLQRDIGALIAAADRTRSIDSTSVRRCSPLSTV
jgi:hypothetical protein